MGESKKSFKQALKHYYSDINLSQLQLERLNKTQNESHLNIQHHRSPDNIRRVAPKIFALTASITAAVLILVLSFSYIKTPDLIINAYADIHKDALLYNEFQPQIKQWMKENKVAEVPSQYKVEMSKFCRLGKQLSTHLRVAGIEQGKMNIFLYHQDRPFYSLNRSGVIADMNWKLIKAGEGLNLLVVYTNDMRERSVKHVLQEMIPQLHV